MMKKIIIRALAATSVIGLFFLAGCGGRSQATNFYVLSPVTDYGIEMKNAANAGSTVSIAISPVVLPKYLKKSQIVTRTGRNELHLAEYDRWAGKFAEDIERVIAENLSHMLFTDKVFSHPPMEAIAIDYHVNIEISRFDGRLGGDMELIARWGIFDNRESLVSGIRATHITRPTRGRGYVDLVAAQSLALAELSREIAAALEKLPGN